jgi:hypothetical protein
MMNEVGWSVLSSNEGISQANIAYPTPNSVLVHDSRSKALIQKQQKQTMIQREKKRRKALLGRVCRLLEPPIQVLADFRRGVLTPRPDVAVFVYARGVGIIYVVETQIARERKVRAKILASLPVRKVLAVDCTQLARGNIRAEELRI